MHEKNRKFKEPKHSKKNEKLDEFMCASFDVVVAVDDEQRNVQREEQNTEADGMRRTEQLSVA